MIENCCIHILLLFPLIKNVISVDVPLHRFNIWHRDHFYTTNINELTVYYEGIECTVSNAPGAGLIPVYRYYNKDINHFYTATKDEVTHWIDEGIRFYCWSQNSDDKTPLYRFYKNDDHFYTVFQDEGLRSGYRYEGVLCYVKPVNGRKIIQIEFDVWQKYEKSIRIGSVYESLYLDIGVNHHNVKFKEYSNENTQKWKIKPLTKYAPWFRLENTEAEENLEWFCDYADRVGCPDDYYEEKKDNCKKWDTCTVSNENYAKYLTAVDNQGDFDCNLKPYRGESESWKISFFDQVTGFARIQWQSGYLQRAADSNDAKSKDSVNDRGVFVLVDVESGNHLVFNYVGGSVSVYTLWLNIAVSGVTALVVLSFVFSWYFVLRFKKKALYHVVDNLDEDIET